MSTTQIWNNLVAYSTQIGLLVGIGAALPFLLRLKAPRARLLNWQLLLLACLALPWARPWHSEVIALSTPPAAAALNINVAAAASPHAALPPSAEIALWILALGAFARLVWLAIGLIKLSRYRRHGCPMPAPPEWLGSARHVRLLLSDEISGPVTFGFLRPVVLLPANYPSMPDAMRDAILFHELLHVERRDWLFTLGEEVVRAAFWFHPAIWWVLGEIQLSREQTVDRAVIEMTSARDPYVDTLLAMAGVNPQIDLAPASLFLRRRHLKQRVMGVMEEMREVRMSKTKTIAAQAIALAAIAAACWIVTGAIPLQAQAQMVADALGVTVNLNGSQLMHRTSVAYPAAAIAKGVEGTVVVQVRLDPKGEVIDAAVLSGPDELRRAVQQSVLNWHFDKSESSSTRVVNIDFVKPANAAVGGASSVAVSQSAVLTLRAKQEMDKLQSEQRASAQTESAAKQQMALAGTQMMSRGTLAQIDVVGLSDSARDELLAALPLHVGDSYSPEDLSRVIDAVRQFDEHLIVTDRATTGGEHSLRISTQPVAPAASPAITGNIPPGAQKIGGNVMAANLINPVKPIYPPLAKMARQQGTVQFQAVIGKDGTIEELSVISGPPLLIQAAQDAVKQWTYKPTMLNGNPVEVVTTISVNFTLAGEPPPAPPQ